MNYTIIKNLYKKEILDVLRDKKTVLMMLVVPLVLYPLMFIFGMQMMTTITTGMASRTYPIAFSWEGIDEAEQESLRQLFREQETDGEKTFTIQEVEDGMSALLDGDIDVFVTVKKDTDNEARFVFEVFYESAVNNSNYGTDLVAETLNSYESNLAKQRVEEAGLNVETVLDSVETVYKDQSSGEESAGSLLGMVLPFMLVVSLLLGTMYPAIDTTAGERERGTLETVLTLPVTNQELIVSKFLTVATIGIVSAILNLIAMCGVGAYMYNMVTAVSEQNSKINMAKFLPAFVVGILGVLAFAVFISAITMCVCAFAKSYKEANNYITPVTLVVMFASFVAFVPNVTLGKGMALIPVANICLLIRDLLAFKFMFRDIVLVLISNVVYGALAIWLLSKIYNSESVLFGDSGSAIQIFEKRSNMKKGGVPTLGDMWLVLALAAMAIVYAGGAMQIKFGYFGVLGTQIMIVGLPLLAAWYGKKNLKETFRMKLCKPKYVLGGIFMIVGAICLGMLLTAVTSAIFPSSADNVSISMESLLGDSFIETLLVVAFAPAICEELMFRGYIFTTLEHSKKMKPFTAIFLAAALFGAYHMSIVKFFTTGLLGFVICYIAYVSGSILPGMLMHFMNNALSVIVMYYPNQVAKVCPFLVEETFSIPVMVGLLVVGTVGIIIGKVLVGKPKTIVTDTKI